ncbi:MAG: hypothetical protein JWQ47_2837 [Glaciihabitans sp.]|nr:hypothetical protein [Glaciihabitans sp.]
MSHGLSLPMSATAPPLDPTAQQARQQLLNELSKPEYAQAKPTLWDDFLKWLENLLNGLRPQSNLGITGFNLGPALIILLVLAALVVAFLVFGVPRLNRRSRAVGALFGDDDERDSVTLRRAAERAAASGDFATAIAEAFRSIARGLSERTVVSTFPGTTADGFARQAAASFPASADALRVAADSFDGVRYLGAPGSEQQWLAIAALERELRSAKPILLGTLEGVSA